MPGTLSQGTSYALYVKIGHLRGPGLVPEQIQAGFVIPILRQTLILNPSNVWVPLPNRKTSKSSW